jgi:P27 family predicted phage terminase small subunit
MRGRKPKPTHLRVLEGNRGKRAINHTEPQLPDESPEEMPAELKVALPSIATRAQAEWRRLAPILLARRALTTADRSALIALCLEWARYLDATEKTTALVVTTPSGYPMPNPYLTVASKAFAACARLWPELGLTPSSRSRVQVDGAPAGDPFAEFDALPPLPQLPDDTTH